VSHAPVVDPPAVPLRATGVELLGPLRGCGHRRPPGLARRADGQVLQLTPLLYAVLDALDGERDLAAVADHVWARTGTAVEADDIGFLVDARLRPLGLVRGVDGSEPEARRASPLLALRWKWVVTDPVVTRRITAPFTRLFHPLVAAPAVVTFLAVTWWVLVERGLAAATDEVFSSPGMLLAVLGLSVLSTAWHEVGHAAACAYGGATPGAMGAGLYLVWPAFYTEVSDSYRLDRIGRLRVDLGGLYFNALFALGVVGVWTVVRRDALLLVVALQVLQMARQLLPLVRFDGYHLLADLTGVPDLFRHVRPTLLGLLPWRETPPETRALRPGVRAVVTVWVAVVVVVLSAIAAAIVLTLPRIVATAWAGAGDQARAAALAAAEGALARATVGALALVALTLPVAGIALLLARTGRRLVLATSRATARDPRLRVAAALTSLVAVTAVATAWWPQGQYAPIDPDERGAVQDLAALASGPGRGAGGGPAAGGGERGGPPVDEPVLAAPEEEHDTTVVAVARCEDPAPPRHRDREQPARATTPAAGPSAVPAARPTARPTSRPPARPAWPFSFPRPPAPGAHDVQALAVGTRDGRTEVAVASGAAWVTDGAPVRHRNEAWAVASCTDCRTVAVSFQAVLVVGSSDVVTPVNLAVATNERCTRCRTHAVATQYVASIDRLPDAATRARVEAEVRALRGLAGSARGLGPVALREELAATQARITTVLEQAGVLVVLTPGAGTVVEDGEVVPDVAVPGTSSTATDPSAGEATEGPSGDGAGEGSPAPSPDPSPSGSTPSPSPAPTPSDSDPPETTSSPSPSPSPAPSGTTSPSPTPASSDGSGTTEDPGSG
jgi:putative peptide zinc metalloprotease protein